MNNGRWSNAFINIFLAAIARSRTMFGFKRSTKPKRKLTKSPAIQANSSIDTKVLYNIPSVSQIAPLPENKSHGILPILSLDGRDMPDIISSDDPSVPTPEPTDLPNSHQPVGVYLSRSMFEE
jgi:hypothetical protein